jgi:hypothetical protein
MIGILRIWAMLLSVASCASPTASRTGSASASSLSQKDLSALCKSVAPPMEPIQQTRCDAQNGEPTNPTLSPEQVAKSLWQLIVEVEASYPFEKSSVEALLGVELGLRQSTDRQCYYRSVKVAANRFAVRLFEVEFVPGSSSPAVLTLHLDRSPVSIAMAKTEFKGGHAVPPPPPYPGMEHYGSAYFVQRPWGVLSFGSCSGGGLALLAFSPGDEVPNGV